MSVWLQSEAIQTRIQLISVLQEGASENVTILLLGNKIDCAKRQVTTQDGESLAKVWSRDITLSAHHARNKSVHSFTGTKGSCFNPTGVQLSIHGVQRLHRGKRDSVTGNRGQVTSL